MRSRRGDEPPTGVDDATDRRAQAQVVGVAVLLGLTVVSLGALTAAVGTVVDENAASADAARVADGMTTALDPVDRTGRSRERLAFTGGRLHTVDRELRVIRGTRTVRTLETGALVYRADGGVRVAYVAGAVVRGTGEGADLHDPPPVTASRGEGGVLVVGAARLGDDAGAVSGQGGTTVPLRTNVRHDRTALGTGRFRVAVETATPAALAPFFAEQGATTDRRDIDGDGVPSVVATYPGERRAYLVVHDLHLRMGDADGTPPTPTPTDGKQGDDGRDGDDSDGGTLPVPPAPPVDPPAPPVEPPGDDRHDGDEADRTGEQEPGEERESDEQEHHREDQTSRSVPGEEREDEESREQLGRGVEPSPRTTDTGSGASRPLHHPRGGR